MLKIIVEDLIYRNSFTLSIPTLFMLWAGCTKTAGALPKIKIRPLNIFRQPGSVA